MKRTLRHTDPSASLAKKTADMNEHIRLAEQAIGHVWEYLSQILQISSQDNPDWKTIKEIVSVLQKLIQNYQQLQMLSKQQSLGEADQRDLMLSEDTIMDIEEQLNLL